MAHPKQRSTRLLADVVSVIIVAAVTALSMHGCGDASANERHQRDLARLRADLNKERARVSKLQATVKRLKSDIAGLKKRLVPFEQRTFAKPFRGGRVKRSSGDLELPSGVRVVGVGERGKKTSLRRHIAGFRGGLFGYWATWCKPCTSKEELHHLRVLQKQLRPYHVDLVSVLIDDLKKAQASPKAGKWLYPFWFVKDGHMQMLPRSMVQKMGLGLPFFLLTDNEGRIRWHHRGKLDDAAVRDFITAAARL